MVVFGMVAQVYSLKPKSNQDYWLAKIARKRERDKQVTNELKRETGM